MPSCGTTTRTTRTLGAIAQLRAVHTPDRGCRQRKARGSRWRGAKGSERHLSADVNIDAHLTQNKPSSVPLFSCNHLRIAKSINSHLVLLGQVADTIAFSRPAVKRDKKKALVQGGLKSLLAASSSSIQAFTAAQLASQSSLDGRTVH